MAMKRCNNGHFYDSTKHSACPFCGVADLDMRATMPVRNPVTTGAAGAPVIPPPPVNAPAQEPEERTVARNSFTSAKTVPRGVTPSDNGKTIGIMRNKMGFEPVVGWLVCTKGQSIGKDYRLKSEKNFIGRAQNMDVCILEDHSVSRTNHAVVSYDPKNNKFVLRQGEGHGLVYLNGDEVMASAELKSGDCIELGDTTLMFIPFCGEGFKWEKED